MKFEEPHNTFEPAPEYDERLASFSLLRTFIEGGSEAPLLGSKFVTDSNGMLCRMDIAEPPLSIILPALKEETLKSLQEYLEDFNKEYSEYTCSVNPVHENVSDKFNNLWTLDAQRFMFELKITEA